MPTTTPDAVLDQGDMTDQAANASTATAQSRLPAKLTRRPALPPLARRAIRSVTDLVGATAGYLIFFSAAIAIGFATAWFAVQGGTPFNTEKNGPWVAWTYAGDVEAEPYSRARFGGLGMLVYAGDRIVRYEARIDSEGRRLHSSCVYEIVSPPLNAAWWSLAVFNARGRLVGNAAERYGYNRANVSRDGSGQFRIVLARDAYPGNWLPTGAAGRMVIVIEAMEPDDSEAADVPPFSLPPIRRVTC